MVHYLGTTTASLTTTPIRHTIRAKEQQTTTGGSHEQLDNSPLAPR